MAKKQAAESDVVEAPVSKRPKVLVHQGHHEDGVLRPAAHTEIDWPDPDLVWDAKAQPATVYIGGEPYVQVGHAADGSKVYAHQDVKKRA